MKAGGSYGSVFAWDLRRQQQPIILSGIGTNDTASNICISSSDVWEVQYDTFMSSSNRATANISSDRVLPVMMCSEDGILAVVKQGMIFIFYFFISVKKLYFKHKHII